MAKSSSDRIARELKRARRDRRRDRLRLPERPEQAPGVAPEGSEGERANELGAGGSGDVVGGDVDPDEGREV